MPIKIYTSNRQEDLAALLSEKLAAECAGNGIFHRPQIIVPNRGIARYLTLQLTRQNKIVMGVEFPYLMTFLLRNVGKLEGDITEQGEDVHDPCSWDALLNVNSLNFRIYSLLPELLKKTEFQPLKNYLKNNDTPCRRWKLAAALATLYDRYILYRPDWICSWEKEDSAPESIKKQDHPTEIWQRNLWRAIRKEWPRTPKNRPVHFAGFLELLSKGKWSLPDDRPIRLFGFSSIAEPILNCLEKLENDVEIYHLTPCEEYWGDAHSRKTELEHLLLLWETSKSRKLSGEEKNNFFANLEELFCQNNPLLGLFASQGREFFVRSLDWINIPLFQQTSEPETLLEKLQDRMRKNTPLPAEQPEKAAHAARSIQIHNCCSEYREVETLHEYLLGCFARDDKLKFNDIIIMSPTPERYSAFIDAVFHNPANGDNKLRVSLADRSTAVQIHPVQWFLKLLKIFNTPLSAPEVMELFSNPDLLTSFDISPDDLNLLINGIRKAGIRWGWDEKERETFCGVSFKESSWRRGLDRLLWNYASLGSGNFCDNEKNIYAIENYNIDGILLGKFCKFVDELHNTVCFMRQAQQQPVVLSEWCAFLQERATFFFGKSSPLHSPLRTFLANLQRNAANAECANLPLETDAMLAILQDLADTIPDKQGDFLRGRITFCGLRPMRSIPAKIICLLGMNHDTFPRQNPQSGFDLMHSFPRRGDPSLLADEQQLFIETLLSARNAIYISYCGKGIRDNKLYPASSCVEELRNYLKENFGENSWYDHVEPTQAFSAELFCDGNPVQSHSTALFDCIPYLMQQTQSVPDTENVRYKLTALDEEFELPESVYKIHLDTLVTFFKNPTEYFQKNILKASIPYLKDNELPGTEEFFMQKPEYCEKLKEYIFSQLQNSGPTEKIPEEIPEELLATLQNNGKLPIYKGLEKNLPVWDLVSAQYKNYRKQKSDFSELPPCSFTSEGIRLELPKIELYRGVQLFPIFQPLPTAAYKIVLYHTAANLSCETETVIVSENEEYSLQPMGPEKAGKHMKQILSLYKAGLRKPLLFFPRTSYAAYAKIKDEWASEQKFFKYWYAEKPAEDKIREIAGQFFLDIKTGAN